jgi:hypothetical protein
MMARNIAARLNNLDSRRRGIDRLERLNEAEQLAVLAKSFTADSWQTRAGAQPFTRYALGAMQEVDSDYTRVSIETAERGCRQLLSGLTAAGFSVDFRLQGSVALNVHIRGVSDVDLLSFATNFFTYATAGQRSQLGLYTGTTSKNSIGVLAGLRREVENILKEKFPAAKVDTSGGKAVNISGGSLARPVDVVPSHWFDSIAYQASGQEHDRGVTILDRKVPETIKNWPFLHIKRVGDRCDNVHGGLRKAIRLCKNVKADAEEEGQDISLPSFDIAATMYHANMDALASGSVYELAILAETQRHLDALACNHELAKALRVPDGSRPIFDTNGKLRGLNRLSYEMDDLVREVAKEQNGYLSSLAEPPLPVSRAVLAAAFIASP